MKTVHMKIYIILMFLSGVLQMSIFNLSWEYFSIIQAIHIVSSAFVSFIFLIPYVNRHTYEYMIVKKANSKSGIILGLILFLIIGSGVYLFLVGNRGSDIYGLISYYTHLYGSFILMLFLFIHVRQKIEAKNATLGVLALLLILSAPDSLQASDKTSSKLFNIELQEGVDRYHTEDWTNSTKCKSCHSDIFDQWADSNHRHLTESNPYYMVLENLAAADKGEEFRQWCIGCHNPSALSTMQGRSTHGMIANDMPDMIFEKGSKQLVDDFAIHGNSKLEQGVSCVTCHRITKTTSMGNSSYTLAIKSREKYVYEEHSFGLRAWLGEKFINANPVKHKESYSNEIYKSSAYCASCHDEFLPESKKEIVSTFKEWEKSSFNNPDDKTKHKSCIDCHMTNLVDGEYTPLEGQSTDGGEVKKDIKVHYFAGGNHFLSGLKNPINEDQSLQLLRRSAELDVALNASALEVGVKNVGAGHHLPTGTSDFRELWLEITLKDADGRVILERGKLKADGNLGEDARPYMKVFGDESGAPVGLFFWRYKKLLSDTRIAAGERRIETYKIANFERLKKPLSVDVKLNFRIYPQWVTDVVQNAYPQLPSPPVVVLETLKKEL